MQVPNIKLCRNGGEVKFLTSIRQQPSASLQLKLIAVLNNASLLARINGGRKEFLTISTNDIGMFWHGYKNLDHFASTKLGGQP